MKLSPKTVRIIGLVVLIVVFGGALLLNHFREGISVQPSEDPISNGIVERWGAALPAGFTKVSVEDISGSGGYNFAKLTYAEDMSKVLSQWTPCDDETRTTFDTIVDAQLAHPETSPEEAELITANRPVIGDDWRGFNLKNQDDPGDIILLVYDPATMTMYIAEQQNNETAE